MDRHHTFDFVEGTRPAPMAPEIRHFYPASDEYFSYHNYTMEDMNKALNDLQTYIDEEGPFDGAIGFSQGAGLIATYLLRWSYERPGDPLPFKCAIFFSGGSPIDPMALGAGTLQWMKTSDSQISLPTAHMWGAKDHLHEDAERLFAICDDRKRTIYLHSQGHEIPSPKAKEDVQGCVRVIRRTIEKAELEV
ncbi:unnamed protein product [Penicillium glandicola]